jgi:hypothetical protein
LGDNALLVRLYMDHRCALLELTDKREGVVAHFDFGVLISGGIFPMPIYARHWLGMADNSPSLSIPPVFTLAADFATATNPITVDLAGGEKLKELVRDRHLIL